MKLECNVRRSTLSAEVMKFFTNSYEYECTKQWYGTMLMVQLLLEVTAGNSSGQNAKLTYNGLEIERSSNTFTINGAKLTLKQTTDRSQLLFLQHQM